MTHRDLANLLGTPIQKPHSNPKLDREEDRLAKQQLLLLEEAVACVEASLQNIGTLLQDFTLPKALINAMGMSATEIHSQLPALRQAIKDAAHEDV